MEKSTYRPVIWLTIIHLLASILACVVAYNLWTQEAVWAASYGSLIMLTNLWVLIWVGRRLFVKKVFALPIALIVIKYALLMGILQMLIVSYGTHVGGLSIGLSTIILTALGYAFVTRIMKADEGQSE